MGAKPPLTILIVEDDPNDALVIENAFKSIRVKIHMHTCPDAMEAIAYLKREGKYADTDAYPFPRVLITDLNMPKGSGLKLLEWIGKHPECAVIPKIVWSASARESDVKLAFEFGANCYFQKPSSFEDVVRVVQLIHDFWTKSLIPPLPEKC